MLIISYYYFKEIYHFIQQKLFLTLIPEVWSNDAVISALHHRNNYIFKYFQIENSYFKL